MRRAFSLILWFAVAAPLVVCGQATDNTIYVKQFPGVDVGTKVANAMATCNPNTAVPCILVLDPSLATTPAGVLPGLSSNMTLLDYRSGPLSASIKNLNGGRVFADLYCANPPALDQTCVNSAVAALPNGGTVVLRPGQTYNVNACTADGDGSWTGGILIHGVNGIHVEANGAKIVLNVNQDNCRAVDVWTVRDFTYEGGVITTNYQGVGTLFALHGTGDRGNRVSSVMLGTLQEASWGSPTKGADIGFDNGGTDNGGTMDEQVFTGLQFHGNTHDLIQRGTYMANQLYIGGRSLRQRADGEQYGF